MFRLTSQWEQVNTLWEAREAEAPPAHRKDPVPAGPQVPRATGFQPGEERATSLPPCSSHLAVTQLTCPLFTTSIFLSNSSVCIISLLVTSIHLTRHWLKREVWVSCDAPAGPHTWTGLPQLPPPSPYLLLVGSVSCADVQGAWAPSRQHPCTKHLSIPLLLWWPRAQPSCSL